MAERGARLLRGRRLELWVSAVVLALDQITKAIVRASLPLHASVEIVPGLLNFTHVRNTGAVFGIMSTADFPMKPVVLALVALAGLIGIAWYSSTLGRDQLLARLSLALVLGGAAGNLIDRVVDGAVVDFVDVYWRTYHFWAFNVADSAITVGVVLMLIDAIGIGGKHVSTAA